MAKPVSPKEPPLAETTTAQKERKPRATTLYPKVSLLEALRLAESIRDNNAGQPYNRIDLAASIDLSPESSGFRALITASGKFGLTEGSYKAERISLADCGRSIVSPTSDEEKAESLLTALYQVDFYRAFFERFKNHRLPRKDLLLNTLERDFSIPHGDREQCYELLIKNATQLGLLKDVSGTPYVRFDRPTVGLPPEAPVEQQHDDLELAPNDEEEQSQSSVPSPPGLALARPVDAATTHKPTIFISHSKNMRI